MTKAESVGAVYIYIYIGNLLNKNKEGENAFINNGKRQIELIE